MVWKDQKSHLERKLREIQSQSPELTQSLREYIETLEADLYPERKKKKGGSGWIWFLVIGGVMVLGLIGFLLEKKRKRKF